MRACPRIRVRRLLYALPLIVGPLAPTAFPSAIAVGDRVVTAETETEPVESPSDAADDAAIWPHPTDPALSLVIGTDKRGGAVEVYDLAGKRLQRITGARANGVDLRRGVPLGGGLVDLVSVGGDDHRFFHVDATARRLTPVPIGTDGSRVPPNGVCLYQSAATRKLYVFGISLQSEVEQLELTDEGGKLRLAPVGRRWDVGSDSEACVADDDLGRLYINEADVAIWKYGAEPHEPTRPTDRSAVDRIRGGKLVADVEGLTIIDQPDGGGYLVASSQGENAFTMYRRDGDNAFVAKFRVEGGRHADGCSNTDGIDAYAGNLGPAFPHGMFVCQDHSNIKPGPSGNQNFKFVRLEHIVAVGPTMPVPARPQLPGVTDAPLAPTPSGPPGAPAARGVWVLRADGTVTAHGTVRTFGSAAGQPLRAPMVGMAATPSRNGYWLVASDGGIFTFGDATFHGSTGAAHLNKPIVGMAPTPTGRGYWLVASDGRTFSFGDAAVVATPAGGNSTAPVVGMAA